ncbi:hypothetical protein T484DRAFT_1808358 [Baffinella frigidus]|nr:hypothetical protein T484DRAFT_1808358 [Cryptophyta sp. CCMP2293]
MHPAVDGLAMAHVASEDFDLAGIRFKKAAGFIPLFKNDPMAHVASEDFNLAGIRFKKAAGFVPLFKDFELAGIRFKKAAGFVPLFKNDPTAHVASEDLKLAGIRFKKAAGFVPLFKVAMRKEMTRLGWTGLDAFDPTRAAAASSRRPCFICASLLCEVAMRKETTRLGWTGLDAFDPTRWLAADGSIDDEKAKQILSFGGGARLCPGNRFAKKQLLISSVLILSQFSSVRHDEGVSGVQGCNNLKDSTPR